MVFFHWTEWIPVVAAAFAVSFLFMTLIRPTAPLLSVTWPVLAVEVIVGLVGFVLHAVSDLRRPAAGAASAGLLDRFVFGAPAFAPLLFADLAALGAIASWATASAAQEAPGNTETTTGRNT
jgi:hypothetical protein